MRKLILFASFFIMVVSFQNCADQVRFASVEAASTTNNGNSTPDTVLQQAQQSYSSATTTKAIDMVWVIDNSASMSKNVALVKQNFAAFIKSLGSQVDINIALISRSQALSYNTEISLSDYTSQGLQIPFLVHSYNPMLVAAASTCPATPDASDVFCLAVQKNTRYNRVYGSLNSFFRSGSQKVFVFVSDDDSSAATNTTIQFDKASDPTSTSIDAIGGKALVENEDYILPATFISRMKSAFGSTASFKSFGFIAGDKATSPCLARPSVNYKALVDASGGSAFNICNTSWDSAFSNLTSRVVDYAGSTYTVADSNFVSIDTVVLNGQTLKLGQDYTVNGNVVTLTASLLQSVGSYSITVNYQRSANSAISKSQ